MHAPRGAVPPQEPPPPAAPPWRGVSQGTALFLGLFILVRLWRNAESSGSDLLAWWIDVRPCPPGAARALLAVAAMLLILFAVMPRLSVARKRLTLLAVVSLFALAAWNAYLFFSLLERKEIATGFPVPFAVHWGAMLAVIFPGLNAAAGVSSNPARDLFVGLLAFALCAVGLPLAQIAGYGLHEHRREADAIVLFPVRDRESAAKQPTESDGGKTPADAGKTEPRPLGARETQALELAARAYRDRLAKTVVVLHEAGHQQLQHAEELRLRLVQAAVAEADIVLDTGGNKSPDKLRTAVETLKRRGIARPLVIDEYHRLLRIRLVCKNNGIDAATVPIPGASRGKVTWEDLQEEVQALWVHSLRPPRAFEKTEP